MSNLFFQLIHPSDTPFTIKSKSSSCKFDTKNFIKLNEKIDTFRQTKEQNSNLQEFLAKVDQLKINNTHYIFRFFNLFDENDLANTSRPTGYIHIDDHHYSNPQLCCKVTEAKKRKNYNNTRYVNQKFHKLITTMVGGQIYEDLLKNKTYCERSTLMEKLRLNILYSLFDSLEKGGDLLMAHIYNICDCTTIEFFYLCSLLFEKVTILYFDDFFIYCQNFRFENRISQKDLKKIIAKPFDIQPKTDYTQLISFLNQSALQKIQHINFLLNQQYDEYLYLYTMDLIQKAENFKMDSTFILKIQKKLIEIFRNVFIQNKFVKIHSAIKGEEGKSIQQFIQKNNFKKCLEIGMAFGISAFYILTSSPQVHLTSIDPFQSTDWESSGKKLLKQTGLDKNHTLIEELSYVALPKLLEKHGEESFDFIFIDGNHLFDYTLIDFFYSDKLLKVGGILLIDDALHKGVAKCVKYIDTNYHFMKRVPSTRTQAAYLKTKKDDRPWYFHAHF